MKNDIFAKLLASDQFKEEFLVAEAQARLSQLLDDKGVCRAELARRLNVTRARVTQIFSDEAKNLTFRLLIRSYLALGEEPVIVPRSEYDALKAKRSETQANEKSSTPQDAVDGMAEAVIAKLLRATIGERQVESERLKRNDDAKEWASAGSNVIALRERAYG